MLELSNARIDQILHQETPKTEELRTILRSIYTRYMHLYETYFANLDALDDVEIAKLRAYHEETKSLIKHYAMDIPLDVCRGLREFEKRYDAKLLGPEWQSYLLDNFEEFKKKNTGSEEELKREFSKEVMDAFYDLMDYVFRAGFGTGSQTMEDIVNGLTGLLFGK